MMALLGSDCSDSRENTGISPWTVPTLSLQVGNGKFIVTYVQAGHPTRSKLQGQVSIIRCCHLNDRSQKEQRAL